MTALIPVQLLPEDLLALHAAHPQRYPVLLQSVARGDPLGRYDILFAYPEERLTLRAGGELDCTADVERARTFLSTLDRWWHRERVPRESEEIPFFGGWFLYLGYELAQQIEPSVRFKIERKGATSACAIRFRSALIIRHKDRAAWIAEEAPGCGHARKIRDDLQSLAQSRFPARLIDDLSEEAEELFTTRVKRALEHIANGDVYQANLSRRWLGNLAENVQPHEVYKSLQRSNPAPFAALAILDDMTIVSSSPERLVAVRGGMVATRPIAGTRPRKADRTDDSERLRELHTHPKERAEHVMLIDLERNDLGRVCESGSVEVDEFMALESYAHVHHIVSNVRGKLRADATPGEIIGAVFPGGTITGCPKVRCMQLIAELEGQPRGAYTGSLGYLNRDGSMDLNILIRSFEIRGREISFRAGAGIVSDSIPERELEETRAKARGLIQALSG